MSVNPFHVTTAPGLTLCAGLHLWLCGPSAVIIQSWSAALSNCGKRKLQNPAETTKDYLIAMPGRIRDCYWCGMLRKTWQIPRPRWRAVGMSWDSFLYLGTKTFLSQGLFVCGGQGKENTPTPLTNNSTVFYSSRSEGLGLVHFLFSTPRCGPPTQFYPEPIFVYCDACRKIPGKKLSTDRFVIFS